MTLRRAVLVPLAATLAVLMAAPAALAHAAVTPLPVETELLADEGEDAFYWIDGYDLFDLLVREAYHAPADAEGVIFRFTLYGGFGPTPTTDALHIEIGSADAGPLRITTTDDQTWTGDMEIVFLDIVADEPPFTGYTAKVQAFVPYETLGLQKGGTLDGVWMASYAGDELVDLAPGGIFVPGTMGAGEVPTESRRLVESHPLGGPTGYAKVLARATGETLTLTVENPFGDLGQHLSVHPQETPGWTITTDLPSQASVEGDESATFTYAVTVGPEATDPLPIAVLTDLGGREWHYLGYENGTLTLHGDAAAATVVPPEVENESPGLGLGVLGVLAVVGIVVGRCGRRSR